MVSCRIEKAFITNMTDVMKIANGKPNKRILFGGDNV